MISLTLTSLHGGISRATPGAYHEATRVQFNAMPGVRWVPELKCYEGPTEAVEIAAAVLESAGVAHVSRGSALAPAAALAPLALEAEGLREYQRDGATWILHMLRSHGAALLADEMGIGKSAQAIAAADVLGGGVLVICPAVVVPHWEAQITRWALHFGITGDFGEAPAGTRRKSVRLDWAQQQKRWEVLSYEAAAKRLSLGGVRAVVLDEIHYLKNARAKRTEAIRTLLDACPVRPFLIGLSGTPMTARPCDLWAVLDTLFPGRFGSFWQFSKRYCNGHYEPIPGTERSCWDSSGSSNEGELSARLAHYMLRRTKADVALELPPRQRVMLEVAMPNGAAKGLEAARIALASSRSTTSLQALLSASEDHKLDAAEALAREVLEAGGRPLLLTLRRSTATELGIRLCCPHVTGDTPVELRRALLLGLEPLGRGAPTSSLAAGVATLASVTTGIDLTEFDSVIFVGLDWVPSTLLQGEARIHRIGQRKSVTAYYLIGLGTADEVVRERVIDRLDTLATLLGADGSDSLGATLKGGDDDSLLASLIAGICGNSTGDDAASVLAFE